jgi:COP9 signalosome complex subunit 4
MVVGRRVLGDFVSALCGGTDMQKKASGDDVEEEAQWAKIGKDVFEGEKGGEIRREVVEGVLAGGLAGWCEEQVCQSKLH